MRLLQHFYLQNVADGSLYPVFRFCFGYASQVMKPNYHFSDYVGSVLLLQKDELL